MHLSTYCCMCRVNHRVFSCRIMQRQLTSGFGDGDSRLLQHYGIAPKNVSCHVTFSLSLSAATRRCPLPYFQCYGVAYLGTKNLCIERHRVCDRILDCEDGTDEENCPCKDDEFQCVSNGMCISMDLRCDHDSDCIDHSDEMNCSEYCLGWKGDGGGRSRGFILFVARGGGGGGDHTHTHTHTHTTFLLSLSLSPLLLPPTPPPIPLPLFLPPSPSLPLLPPLHSCPPVLFKRTSLRQCESSQKESLRLNKCSISRVPPLFLYGLNCECTTW